MLQSATIVRTPNVTAEPPKESADRSTRAAEELAGAPAIVSGAPTGDSRVSNFGNLLSLDPMLVPTSAQGRCADLGLCRLLRFSLSKQEAQMSIAADADDLELAVRNALLTTRATAACPPSIPDVTIRVGDDAAETHAFYRARNLVRSDGTGWDHDLLMQEIARQLADAAERVCPRCSGESPF
jgi:hypothetical protein